MTVYLDCYSTTPLEPRVRAEILHYLTEDFGNPSSRYHAFATVAKKAVRKARHQVAAVFDTKPDGVIFTSGATEANNLAIFGLAPHGEANQKRHIISSQIEHRSVLEPLSVLGDNGFEVELLPCTGGGWVDPEALKKALRPDTLLVSIMHVNNETGVIQPVMDYVQALSDHPAFFHLDAAMGTGLGYKSLQHKRIDMISISSHKLFGPKGVGALVFRRRGVVKPPLTPLMFGGGQERGLRPGTLPVPLIAGFGLAVELAMHWRRERQKRCLEFREKLLQVLTPLAPILVGDRERSMPDALAVCFPTLRAEDMIVALQPEMILSAGGDDMACEHGSSHVLSAMGIGAQTARGFLRFSWSYMTEDPKWEVMSATFKHLLANPPDQFVRAQSTTEPAD